MFTSTTKSWVVLCGMIWVAGWTTSNTVLAQFGTLSLLSGETYVPMGSTGLTYTTGENKHGAAIALPFCFPWGDTLYTHLYIHENGYVVFNASTGSTWSTTPAEILTQYDDVVAGFAHNLATSPNSSMRYLVADHQVTIRYEDMPRYFQDGANTFEIRLHATGEIDFWYASITTAGAWMGLASTRMSPEILQGLTLDLNAADGHDGQWYRYTPQGRASDLTLFGTAGTDGQDAGWRMLTMPGGAQCLDALRAAVPFCPNCSMLMHYDPLGRVWVDATPNVTPDATPGIRTLPVGQGFILYLFDREFSGGLTEGGLSLSTVGPAPAAEIVIETPQEGQFHLLGNPFDAPLPVSQLDLVTRGFQSSVQTYNPATQAYQILEPGDTIAPWQGFFVERTLPNQGATTITISPPSAGKSFPHPPHATPIATIRAAHAAASSAQRENIISLTYHTEAKMGRDPLDVSSAPRVADGLFLAFRESDADYARLTMPTIPERLDFVVSSPERTTETTIALQGIGYVQCAEGAGDGITWILPARASIDRIPCTWMAHPGSHVAIDGGSHDEHGARGWTVFPNPATTQLTFTTAIAWLEAFDLTGRRMGHWVNIQQLEIDAWTPGLYLLRDDAGYTQIIHRIP